MDAVHGSGRGPVSCLPLIGAVDRQADGSGSRAARGAVAVAAVDAVLTRPDACEWSSSRVGQVRQYGAGCRFRCGTRLLLVDGGVGCGGVLGVVCWQPDLP